MRQTVFWCCLWLISLGAVAQTAPRDFGLDLVWPATQTPGGTVRADARQSGMEANGRRVVLQEWELAGAVDPIALGATYRRLRAHGHSVLNRYDSDGWRLWGAWRARQPGASFRQPGMMLFGETLQDNGALQVITANSSSFASPKVNAAGGQAALVSPLGVGSAHLRAGLYTVAVDGDRLATEWVYGAGGEYPLTPRFNADAAITGFRDDFQGRHYDVELAASLRYALTDRLSVTAGGQYYPRGIPLAGTALSPATAVGAEFGASATDQLRNDAVGILTAHADFTY